MSHVLEYKDNIDLADLTKDPEEAKPPTSQSANNNNDLSAKLNLLNSSISTADQALASATPQEILEAEQARKIGFEEVDSELIKETTATSLS